MVTQDPASQQTPHKAKSGRVHASTDAQTTTSSPSAKPLKRPYSDLEVDHLGQDEDDNDTIHVANDLRSRDHKRSRPVDWPLKSGENTNTRKENQTGRRNTPAKSSSSRRPPKTKTNRPSRFVEGSMKDRASAKPPSLYTGDESDRERRTRQPRRGGKGGLADTASEYGDRQWYGAGIEPSRPSGMYRFGKAIANAFNPIWHGIHGIWKDNRDEEPVPVESVLQQRQAKAEKAYAELKKAGYKGTKGAPKVDIPTIKYEDTAELFPSAPNRDSGIDIDERSSAERKRDGRVFDVEDALLPPARVPGFGRAASPMSDAPSSQKSSLHIRQSLQSLKKVRSHVQLPSAKKTLVPATPMSTGKKDTGGLALKKQPSKKELRLSKKVSDLETKLENARRELRQVMGDAPPVPDLPAKLGPRRFKPGALPSLPSGLVVDGHGNDEKSKAAEEGVHTTNSATIIPDAAPSIATQPAITDKPSKDDKSIAALADILLQSVEASGDPKDEKTTPQKSASKKRKSVRAAGDDVRYKPDSDGDDDLEWTMAKIVTPKRKPGRPRKIPKVTPSTTPVSNTIRKRLPNIPKLTEQSPGPNKPPATSSPPSTSPHTQPLFDPTKVDRAKLLKLRTEPNHFVPFGKLSDDVINVRKEFPTVTDEQLVAFFTASLAEENTDLNVPDPTPQTPAVGKRSETPVNATFAAINHTSTTPLLGRPRSISPAKIPGPQSVTTLSYRAHSPPPAEEDSSPAQAVVEEGDDDEVITVDPEMDASVPPMPKFSLGVEPASGVVVEGLTDRVGFEKVDEGLEVLEEEVEGEIEGGREEYGERERYRPREKEEYQWPEDVF